MDATLPSETIKDSSDPGVVHLDAFLYEEDDEEDLVKEEKLSRAICNKCGSTDTRMRGETKSGISFIPSRLTYRYM